MNPKVLDDYLFNLDYQFTEKTIGMLKDKVDPNNYKYQKTYSIMNPQKNVPPVNLSSLTKKQFQLSLLQLYIQGQKSLTVKLNLDLMAHFMMNCKQTLMYFFNRKNQIWKIVMVLLSKTFIQWKKQMNAQIKKNQKSYDTIIEFLKEILVQQINNNYIKKQKHKIGYGHFKSPRSPSTPISQLNFQTNLAQSSTTIINNFLGEQSQLQKNKYKQLDIKVQLKGLDRSVIMVISEVYLGMVGIKYLNDESKGNTSQMSMKTSPIKAIDKSSVKEESIFFRYQNFHQFLVHSLHIIFYLPNSQKHFPLSSILFQLCSYMFIFSSNQQKPMSLLRFILYNETKLVRAQWQFNEIDRDQQCSYYWLLQQYILLDPQFKSKTLKIISTSIDIGIQTQNHNFLQHWRVLIQIIKLRIFDGILSEEMLKLLMDKSEGNIQAKMHIRQLLTQMFNNLPAHYFIQNCQILLSLQEFLYSNKIKLCQMYFQHYQTMYGQSTKQISNKKIINRIIQLYISVGKQTYIQKNRFMQFYQKIIKNSVKNNQKILCQSLLKQIHMIHITNEMKSIYNFQQMPVNLRQSNYRQIEKVEKQVYELEQQLLKTMFESMDQKGDSYYSKFIKDPKQDYFTSFNTSTYQIYLCHALEKLTSDTFTLEGIQKNIIPSCSITIKSNPVHFNRYKSMFQTLFSYVNKYKILSFNIFKLMTTLESIIEQNKLTERYQWYLRKFKYIIKTQPQKQSVVERLFLDPSTIFIEGRVYGKIYEQSNSSQAGEQLFQYLKQYFLKIKTKISLLLYISNFAAKFFVQFRQRKKFNKDMKDNQQINNFMKELKQLFLKNQYAKIQSYSVESVYMLFIIFHIYLLEEHYIISQQTINIGGRQNRNPYFIQSQGLNQFAQIIKLWCPLFSYFLRNQILLLFTFKQSLGHNLILLLNLPYQRFQSININMRLISLMTVLKTLMGKTNVQNSLYLTSNSNHVEIQFLNLVQKQKNSLIMKAEQINYQINLDLLINQNVKIDNFITIGTSLAKYKIILRQKQIFLLQRKNGLQKNQSKKFQLKQKIGQNVFVQISLIIMQKNQRYINLVINKTNIFKINVQGEIQFAKLEMIGFILLKSISVSRNCSDLHYNSEPNIYKIPLNQSFYNLQELQLQSKIKKNNHISLTKFSFIDCKFFVILKEIFKHNTQLLQQQVFSVFWQKINQIFYTMITKLYSQTDRKSVPIDKVKKNLNGNQFVCIMKDLLKYMIQKYQQYHKIQFPQKMRRLSSNEICFIPKLRRSYTNNSNQQQVCEFKNLQLPIFPQLSINNLLINVILSSQFYYYFLLTSFNKTIWKFYSLKNKISVCKYLKNLLEIQEFRSNVQNLGFELFFNMSNIICSDQQFCGQSITEIKSSEDQLQLPKQLLMNCLTKIMLTHQPNYFLKKKFKYYFYLSENNQCQALKTKFYQLIQLLSQNLVLKAKQDEKTFLIAKYIFISFQQFQYVFINCGIQIKIKILDYLALSENQNKLQQFLKQLTPKIILQLKLWLIVFVKKLLFQLNIKKNKVLEIMKLLGMITERLLSCWQQIRDEEEKQQLLKIIIDQIKYIRNRQKQNLYISPQLLKILREEQFMKFFITIIQEYMVFKKRADIKIQKFLITVFQIIFNLQKKQLLQVLTKYRKFANKNIGVLLYPIKIQVSKQLQLYQLNCFLQFIVQSVLSIQNSLSQEELSYYAIILKDYLLYLLKYYERFCEITGAILYTYPKNYHTYQQSKSNIQKQMKKLNSVETLQLKGGVYYKLMIIVAHLIEMKKDQDLSFLIQQLLFKKLSKEQKQNPSKKPQRASLALLRSANDSNESKFYNKERTFVQIIMNQISGDHKTYFLQKDQLIILQEVTSSKILRFQQEHDLTPYYIDYFLMKIVIYLQWQQCDSDQKTDQINKKYSQLVIKAFQKYQTVYQDIAQQNIDSRVCVNDYCQLVMLTQNQQQLTVTEQVFSPHSRLQNIQMEQPVFSPHQQQLYSDLQSPRKQIKMYQNGRFSRTADKKQIQKSNFLQVTPNPKRTTNRRKSFDITLHIKKKQSLISQIKSDHHVWRTKCLQKQFNKYFRDEAKQLLLFELMHTFFVENSQIKPKSQLFQKTNQVIQKYFQAYQEQLQDIQEQLDSSIIKTKHLIKQLGIKLIAPYLIQKDPIYKIKANYFPNFCLPILSKIPVRNYKLRQKNMRNLSSLVNQEDLNLSITEGINRNIIQDDSIEQFQITQQIITNQQTFFNLRPSNDQKVRAKSYICIQDKSVQQYDQQQKPKQIKYCELVTRKGVMFCQWRIFSKTKKNQEGKVIQKINFLEINSFNQKITKGPRYLKYGSPLSNLLLHQNKFKINLSEIKEILFRKYNQIANNSIQIFQTSGRSYFICMYQKQKAQQLVKQIKSYRGKKIKIVINLAKQFEQRNYTNKWASGQIDNFTYLMLVNKFSSRSFCDTNQYPIFPWVIADFKSQQLDLTKKQTYRDLNLPVGALNPKKLKKFHQKYNMQTQDTGFYLYGSHYSTSLFVYYFLVRMEPFSSLHQQMQGGNWDVPDRLFSSIPHMWESLMSESSPTDIKQAIPQFYYFPSFLRNINNIQLGKRQSGQQVNDVALPNWAKSAEQFVFKMRCALQSTYVSLNLPHWIDLIFGVSQKDIKKHNLFHPLSYSQNISINSVPDNILDATICQISFFGQCPLKLFSSAHRQRKLALPNIFSKDILSGSLIRSRSSSNANKNNNFGKYILPKQGTITKISKLDNSNTKSVIFFKLYDDKEEGIVQFDCQNDGIQNISKKIQAYLKQTFKQRQRHYKQKKLQLNKNMQLAGKKQQFDLHYVGYAEPLSIYVQSQVVQSQIRLRFKQNRRVLTSFIFSHSFISYFYNQMFLVLFGEEGVIIYDWKYQIIGRSVCKDVIYCAVEGQLIFFANQDAHIYLYDIVQSTCTKIFDFDQLDQKPLKGNTQKQKTYDLKMLLFCPKIGITNSQFEDYKFLIVQNKRKVRILNYKHPRANWLKFQEK